MNNVIDTIVAQLQADIPAVTWTRQALSRDMVTQRGGPWPTGCVVVTGADFEGDPGDPRRWVLALDVLIHAHRIENGAAEMFDLLESLVDSLSEAESSDFQRLQVLHADIDPDDNQDGYCALFVRLQLTI